MWVTVVAPGLLASARANAPTLTPEESSQNSFHRKIRSLLFSKPTQNPLKAKSPCKCSPAVPMCYLSSPLPLTHSTPNHHHTSFYHSNKPSTLCVSTPCSPRPLQGLSLTFLSEAFLEHPTLFPNRLWLSNRLYFLSYLFVFSLSVFSLH